jgi:hypothetical protein
LIGKAGPPAFIERAMDADRERAERRRTFCVRIAFIGDEKPVP